VSERLAFNTGAGSGAVRRLGRAQNPKYLRLFTYEAEPDRSAAARRSRSVRMPVTSHTEWDWRGLLGFTAVLFLRPQDQLPGITALHLAEIFALIGILGLVVGRLARGLPIVHVTPEVVALAAFGGAILIGLPFSIWPGGVLAVFTDIYVKLLAIFVLMVTVLSRPQRIEQFAFLIVMASGYIAARAVFDYLRGVNLIENTARVGGAVGGIFGNPNDLALNMVAFLPFALLFAFKPGPPTRRLMAAGVALLMLLTVVLTKSRGGALGLVVMTTVLVVRSVRVRPSIAAGTLAAVILAMPLAPTSFWDRMVSIFVAERDPTGSRQARLDVLEEGWRVFLAYPIVGVGAGQFENYNPPGRQEAWRVNHNALLQVASETGMLGLVPFLFLIVSGFLAARTARRALAGPRTRIRPGAPRGPTVPDTADPEGDSLLLMTTAITPSLAGWLVSAQFASVALNWTFYYVLAIAIAIRELAVARAATVATVDGAASLRAGVRGDPSLLRPASR
jgi:O-antigen ligase